jgi:endonuclease G, mitochondrial
MKRRIYLLLLGCLFSIDPALADYIDARRSMHLKEQPTVNGISLKKIEVGERVALLEGSRQTNGYYYVATQDGYEGYVYRTVGRIMVTDETTFVEDTDHSPLVMDTACEKHLVYGMPQPADQVLCREGYAAGYSYTYKIPLWVTYRITREQILTTGSDRKGISFRQDKTIPTDFRSKNSDYLNSGYDRGHMAPNASMDFSVNAQRESFLFSNIAPQLPDFNRDSHGSTGVWGRLEKYERRWIEQRGDLVIIMGAYPGEEALTIGQGVVVPSHFYRVIVDPATLESIAFWMPQEKNTAHQITRYLASIDEIEQQAKIDLLSNITPAIQDIIEAEKQTALW